MTTAKWIPLLKSKGIETTLRDIFLTKVNEKREAEEIPILLWQAGAFFLLKTMDRWQSSFVTMNLEEDLWSSDIMDFTSTVCQRLLRISGNIFTFVGGQSQEL